MTAQGQHAWTPGPRWPGRAEQTLDRALVAGLLVEILLDPSPSGQPAPRPQDLIKTRLKHACAFHLGGLVTLDRFRTLMGTLDDSFALYYPLLSRVASAFAPSGAGGLERLGEAGEPGLDASALPEEPLEEWRQQHPGLLPCRPHRKLTWSRLKEFLGLTRGRWFGPKDFARHFGLDRKTAWEYLNRLRQAGLLLHNQARSAAARYCLEDRFLRVRAQALRQQVRLVLPDAPEAVSAAQADFLIATGGEAFWEDEWHPGHTPSYGVEFLKPLVAAGVLMVLASSGPLRLLRLHPRWRREEGTPGDGRPA